jgi:hypothetical protein
LVFTFDAKYKQDFEFFYFSRMTEECLRINRRTNNVIELDTVPLVNENSCRNLNTNEYTLSLILFTKSFAISDSLSSCPSYIGHLIYQSNIDYYLKRNSFHMSVGCDNKRKITMSQKQKGMTIGFKKY